MSKILETEAVVLNKIDYGDTSEIVSAYTKDYGKISLIAKGAKSNKSRMGPLVNSFNHLKIVFYDKQTRDVQMLTQADLLNHYSIILEDIERIRYASAIVELIYKLTKQHDQNLILFNGLIRILSLINSIENEPKWLFVKFLNFFCKQIGYELQLENCTICGIPPEEFKEKKFHFELGLLCGECSKNRLAVDNFNSELFKILVCLSSKNMQIQHTSADLEKIIKFFEKYLMYHIPEFNGIQSLKIL